MRHALSLPAYRIIVPAFLTSVVSLAKAKELGGLLWAADQWIDVPLEVIIEQGNAGCLITPLALDQQSSFSRIQALNWYTTTVIVHHPSGIASIKEAVVKFQRELGLPDIPAEYFVVTEFPWGQLLELCWGKAGFAPGGSEYYLFPTILRPVYFGRLRTNWAHVQFLLDLDAGAT